MAHPVIDALNALDPHQLRGLVDENTDQYIGWADRSDSPGSVFLSDVRDDLVTRLADYLGDPPGVGLTFERAQVKVQADMYRMTHENSPTWLIDEIAPMTHDRWLALVDLSLGGWEISAHEVKVRLDGDRQPWVSAETLMDQTLIAVAGVLHRALFDVGAQADQAVDYYATGHEDGA